MLPSIDDDLHIRNERYWLVLSTDIVDQRVLQSKWMRSTPGHIQPKVEVSDTAFP